MPPADVVRHDGDDPYLVVAADKGTATFSDIANALARDYGFWLGDAFASGGTAGYDHKKMGITARGAWEAVKRHFRELGQDIQEDAVHRDRRGRHVGRRVRQRHAAVAAHPAGGGLRPSPHLPGSQTRSRDRPRRAQRLFALPRSSWMDYDKSLLSTGGGIFDRAAKSMALSPEACAVLGIEKPTMAPLDLLRAILTAPVDLLCFGGIGTYVKASSETQRRCRRPRQRSGASRCRPDCAREVIGEGANLGFTQRGRVEAALAGRKINTDALDNSAGVDTSDHEVNIKIATGGAIAHGALQPRPATHCCSR